MCPSLLTAAPPFVGREPELAALTLWLEEAIAGRGGVVLLAGDPGIGKTRLAEEMAVIAQERGVRAFWGRCYEGEGAPAFWPWTEILRAAVRDRPPEPERADVVTGAAELAHLVPEFRRPLPPTTTAHPEAAGPAAGDPVQARFRLFDAVTAFLLDRAVQRPHLLVLDDLQWADTASLLLLQFLARGVRAAPLLVVGAYRDVEVDRAHPLATTLLTLSRERGYQHLHVRGLSAEATAALLAAVHQARAAPLAPALHRLTGGNPLFVQETVRHLAETDRLPAWAEGDATLPAGFAIPEGVRGVIRRRLERLPEAAARVLSLAAVVGREFDLGTLTTVFEGTGVAVLEALDAAESARLVAADGAGVLPRYRFTHDLIHETLYADLDRAARARLHLQVGQALERRHHQADLDQQVAELARHFLQAVPAGGAETAVVYARQAGERAFRQFAYEQAARWLEQALEALGVAAPADAVTRCDLLLALGDALLLAGDPRRVVDAVAPAALALAEVRGEDGRVRAARACRLALVGIVRYSGPGTLVTGPLFHTWAERAGRYAPPDSADRVHADIALADALSGGALAETLRLYHRALALAHTVADPDTLFYAAYQLLNWSGGPCHQTARLALAEEFSARARDGVRPRNAGRALWRCGAVLLDWGRRDRAESLWREVQELAVHTHEPDLLLFAPLSDAIRATLDGRLDEALDALGRLVEWSSQAGSPAYGRRFAARLQERPLLWLGRMADDRVALSLDLHATLAGDVWGPANVAAAALRAAQAGDLAPARGVLDEQLPGLRADEDADANFPWHLVALLELAVALADREACAYLAERLAPMAPCATADWGLTTVARHLGAAAAVLGDAARAREYTEQALTLAERIRFRPEAALARLQLAEVLEREPGVAARARGLLDFAIAELAAMQMRPALDRALHRLAHTTGEPARGPAVYPDGLTAREVEVLRLLATGRTNKEIAAALVVSPRTVQQHTMHIYAKIGARGRADAIAFAHRLGLVPHTAS
jgi:DNA-binding CsgD family transcriptional regulator/tetratricopeptide (TPR) repeat protein